MKTSEAGFPAHVSIIFRTVSRKPWNTGHRLWL